MSIARYAIVHAEPLLVARYLPDNYRVIADSLPGTEDACLVAGQDFAGWTLDGYVLPRLSSGNIGAREVRLEVVA
jgi:hypothetical protein